jgi:hypothetical protein
VRRKGKNACKTLNSKMPFGTKPFDHGIISLCIIERLWEPVVRTKGGLNMSNQLDFLREYIKRLIPSSSGFFVQIGAKMDVKNIINVTIIRDDMPLQKLTETSEKSNIDRL